MRTKLLIGNWKENPQSLEEAKKLVQISEKFQQTQRSFGEDGRKYYVAIAHAVPNIFAPLLISPKKNIILQNISAFESGSHTGEISAKQAKDLCIPMSIVGHSETRLYPGHPHGDEDKEINSKIKNLIQEDMWPILCVGEYERDENFVSFIESQLEKDLDGIESAKLSNIIVAYEPVWAIGEKAKRPATQEEIIESMKAIRNFLDKKTKGNKILYGGSVDETNAKEILSLEQVDGLLVGRASSDINKWTKLLDAIC
jgi:triosephosphate isomerase